MHIDPFVWVVTGPLIAFIAWLRVQPIEHPVRRAMRALAEHDATVTQTCLGFEPPAHLRGDRVLPIAAIAGLSVVTIASLLRCVGLIG